MMTKVNKHGLLMKGLKAAAGETRGLYGHRDGAYVQISYDRDDGAVLTDWHVGNSWSEYHSPSIITVANTRSPMTMQAIANCIARAVRN